MLIKDILRNIIRKFFNQSGYGIYKIPKIQERPPHDCFNNQVMLLQDIKVSTIFDIGAHEGQTYYQYRNLFPEAKIYSFEPFPGTFKGLKIAQSNDPLAQAFKVAISNQCGHQVFYSNESSGTNSLLESSKNIEQYYPSKLFNTLDKIEVETTTIDQVTQNNNISEIHILKMDVQGAELLALKGAIENLRKRSIYLIYTEVSFVKMYENQVIFHELWSWLEQLDYTLYSLYNLYHGLQGQLVSGDAIFIRRELLKNIENNQGK